MKILSRMSKEEIIGLKKRILVIVQDPRIRSMVESVINGCGRYRLVGTFPGIEESSAALKNGNVDIAILDIDLDGMNGIEGANLLSKRYPNIALLMYTDYKDNDSIFEALKAGVSGYIHRNSDFLELVEALDELTQGGTPLSKEVIKIIINNYRISLNSPLSKRERQILSMLATGKTYTEISEELIISKQTSKTHIRNIYTKMNVNRKSDAIQIANSQRWI
jgi:DNA-binding NarL/FixJ family response regulator